MGAVQGFPLDNLAHETEDPGRMTPSSNAHPCRETGAAFDRPLITRRGLCPAAGFTPLSPFLIFPKRLGEIDPLLPSPERDAEPGRGRQWRSDSLPQLSRGLPSALQACFQVPLL